MANITVRSEIPADRSRVATLIAKTYKAEGARVIEKAGLLRALPQFNKNLALVAEHNAEVVAFALLTPVQVGDVAGRAALLAPLAFAAEAAADMPAFLETIAQKAKQQGITCLLVQGEAGSAPAAGFVPAHSCGIESDMTEKNVVLWAKPLVDQLALRGKVHTPAPAQ